MGIAWPSSLPQRPLRTGWQEQPEDGVEAFQPDTGPGMTWERTGAVWVVAASQWRMTTAEVATFESFYRTTLKRGKLPFELAHPRLGTLHRWWLQRGEGRPGYTLTPFGIRWTVAMTLFGEAV